MDKEKANWFSRLLYCIGVVGIILTMTVVILGVLGFGGSPTPIGAEMVSVGFSISILCILLGYWFCHSDTSN